MNKQADPNIMKALANATPARVGVGRSGSRPSTSAWLEFRHDHALARDAVQSELSETFIEQLVQSHRTPLVQTTAASRTDFILFPPKGKKVSDDVLLSLKQSCKSDIDVQIVIGDGLSSAAVEANAADVLAMLEEGLEIEKISFGTPVIVRFCRVAAGDEIAHALNAKAVITLIGERPGLTSSASMSAYITYNPGPQTISSDRTVVSNIHVGGTPPIEAGAYITSLVKTILSSKCSGVRLQQLRA